MWAEFVHWFTTMIVYMYKLTDSIGIPNYGLAIILFSIAIKLVLYPLTHKQMKSMRELQVIQPRMKEIQERYKEDPQTMQKKMAELYKEHGVNPFGGCLPLLIQMPILFAFYQSLINLSTTALLDVPVSHVMFFGINIGAKTQDPYLLTWILPVLVAGTTYWQQKISMADANDPTQKTMLYMMPLFIGYISGTTVPAGLPLYWVTFNILSIAQQLYVNSSINSKKKIGNDVALETQDLDLSDSAETDESAEEKDARRDKGGKIINGAPNRRKKGKKH